MLWNENYYETCCFFYVISTLSMVENLTIFD